ncbi:hypothetical protein D3C86_1749720 [compost metagenome]
MTVFTPGGEHNIVGAQVAFDELAQLGFPRRYPTVGEPAAQPFQTVQRQAEAAQGFGGLLRADRAQPFHRPAPGPRVAGAAIGDRDQLQRTVRRGEQLQEAAATQHFIVGMGCDNDGPGPLRHQRQDVDHR